MVLQLAAHGGFRIRRNYSRVRIAKDAALPNKYYKLQPDIAKLRADLENNVVIPGATLVTETEYTLVKEDLHP